MFLAHFGGAYLVCVNLSEHTFQEIYTWPNRFINILLIYFTPLYYEMIYLLTSMDQNKRDMKVYEFLEKSPLGEIKFSSKSNHRIRTGGRYRMSEQKRTYTHIYLQMFCVQDANIKV